MFVCSCGSGSVHLKQTWSNHKMLLTKVVCTVRQKNIRAVAVFRCKMAFLNWAVEADPGRVQKRTVSHFLDLE